MQMVGATKSFIRKPFVMRSIKLGMIGAGLAVLALIGVLIYVETSFPNLGILEDKALIGLVLVAVLNWNIDYLVKYLLCTTELKNRRFLRLKKQYHSAF
jgi:cell division transport system permease protein